MTVNLFFSELTQHFPCLTTLPRVSFYFPLLLPILTSMGDFKDILGRTLSRSVRKIPGLGRGGQRVRGGRKGAGGCNLVTP